MSNDTIIREVDEELRRDRLRNFWRHGGPWIIVAAVLIVLGVAGYEGWNWWSKTQAASSADQFYAATDIANGTDFAAAKKALDDVIAKTSGGYPTLAQFREASLLAQNGKIDDAVAAYDALSTSLGNTHLRELALILAGNLLIDKGDVNAVEQRVGGSITPADPLRNAAREVLGLVQYKAGKLDDAMKNFTDISNDPLSSQDLRNRIQFYVLQLLAEGAKPIAPPVDQTTASSEPPSAPSSEASAPPASSSQAAVSSSSEAAVSSSASASAEVPASASEPSTAVDGSTELDVTPPTVLDDNLMSMAMPGDVSSAPEASSSASLAPASASSATPISSSIALPSSSEAPIASSAPLASSSLAPISSSAP